MVRILIIVCLVVAVIGGVWWWHNYHSGNVYDGSVIRRDAAMENGTTTMENGQNLGDEVHPTPSRSDAPGTINGDRVDPNGPATASDLGTQTTPITQNPYATPYATGPYATGPYATGPYAKGPYATGPYAMGQNGREIQQPNSSYGRQKPKSEYDGTYPPYQQPYQFGTADSQAPNAPDDLRFRGDGAYELYRQGNVTYRVDTRDGRSCIIYATLEEWSKPYVYRHGCYVR